MSENGESNAAPDWTDMIASFLALWMEQSTRGTQAMLAMLEAMQSAGDVQQMQRRWLDALARSTEDFLRTPAFLGLMKQQLKMITDLKGMQNQVIYGAARQLGLPLADDITGLFERLSSVEKKILSRIGAVESHIKMLEEKVGAVPHGADG